MTPTARVRLYKLQKLAAVPLEQLVRALRAQGHNVTDRHSFVVTEDVAALLASLTFAPAPPKVDRKQPFGGRTVFVDGSNACMLSGTPRLAGGVRPSAMAVTRAR